MLFPRQLLLLILVSLGTLWPACGQEALSQQPLRSTVSVDYRISSGDVIHLHSLDDPKGTESLRVSREGHIEHPYMGPIRIAGLTEQQAARTLERALKGNYLINPKVRVTVLEYTKIRFAVMGAVNNPGTFDEPANQPLSLIHAIAKAGDFKDVANRRKVYVRRQTNGRSETIRVDVKALLANPELPPFLIQDRDTIDVKESLF